METAVRQPLQARAIRTRERLLAAAQVEFSEHGYAATTSKSIARRAGSATGTFYQYFSDKDAALLEIAAHRMGRVAEDAFDALKPAGDSAAAAAATPRSPTEGELEGAMRDDVRARMARVVAIVLAYHREDVGMHAVLSERRHADPELDALTSAGELALVERIAALLATWNASGDHAAMAFVLFGMVEGAVHAHVLGTPFVSDERFVAALVAALERLALPTPRR